MVIAIASILLTLASSGLHSLRAELRLTTAVNHFVHAVHSARLTALRTGNDIVLCPVDAAGGCAAQADWRHGWIAFENATAPAALQPDDDERILQQAAAHPGLAIRGNRRSFVLRPFGRRSTNGTLVFCDTTGLRPPRAVIVSYTGKPRASRERAGGGALHCGSA